MHTRCLAVRLASSIQSALAEARSPPASLSVSLSLALFARIPCFAFALRFLYLLRLPFGADIRCDEVIGHMRVPRPRPMPMPMPMLMHVSARVRVCVCACAFLGLSA